MRRLADGWVLACLIALFITRLAAAQTFNGSALAFRSSGSGSGTWTLNENGYVGTYITLPAPGQVTLSVNAAGTTNDAVAPHMNIVVADTKAGFDVVSGSNSYQHTFDLPAGTFFVRTEFNNDVPTADRRLSIASLNVSGATASNTTNQTTNNVSALAAADTYIENHRKGPAQLALSGVAPGTDVHVTLKQHGFNFGTAVGGTTQNSVNTFLNNSNYSNFLLSHFNTVTQGNAGKWQYNESTRNVVTMSGVDRITQFAEANGLRVRMHNLLWGSQQPTWVNTLLTNAQSTNPTTAATAKADLRQAISNRIDYYIGNNDANPSDDRAAKYFELDLLNEEVHQAAYWNIFGASGMAEIFNEAANAISGANADTKLSLNEYNVLQYGTDNYGNWYRRDTENIANNGGAVGSIGVQYYPFHVADSNAHSPARIQQIFANLSVTGLPISLTEFGVQTGNGTTVNQAATYLTETMRMVFGTPNATTFNIWGFWANDIWNQAPLAALRDANWNPTAPGTAFEQLMSQWTTDLTVPVGPDGTIDFSGFFGKYEITIDGHTFDLDLTKGESLYSLVVAPGDYNGDGQVDAIDYTVWSDTVGSSDDFRADGNGDRVIDDGDYAIWKTLFGTSYAGNGLASIGVPEPASATLLLLTAGALSGFRLRNRTMRSRLVR